MRPDGRRPDELRAVSFEVDFIRSAKRLGAGHARAARASSAPRRSRSRCPAGCAGSGSGWVTAEYGMLPALDVVAEGARRVPRARSTAAPSRSSG